jgi:hypothetical protein
MHGFACKVDIRACGRICEWRKKSGMTDRENRKGRNDWCVWCVRGGSAVPADRDFPDCEKGSGEGQIGAKRCAGGAEPIHKGH